MLRELIDYLRPRKCSLSINKKAINVIKAAQKARQEAQDTIEIARATLNGEDSWFIECVEKPRAEPNAIQQELV